MNTLISKKEEFKYTGTKVQKIITEVIEYDTSVLIAEKEAELAAHLEQKALYLASMDDIEKEIQKTIKRLKNKNND